MQNQPHISTIWILRDIQCIAIDRNLQSIRILEHALELPLLCLKIRVSSNVLLGNENVGNGSLVSHLLKGILNCGTIVCIAKGLAIVYAARVASV